MHMNTRRICFFITFFTMSLLFATGFFTLNYLKANPISGMSLKGSPISLNGAGVPASGSLNGSSPLDGTFNILILGGDVVNKNTDTMMLVNFNPATYKMNILSIPRDTQVTIQGKIRKINFAYPEGGGEMAVDTVKNLLGVNISYYIFIDTSVFRKIIDQLDGIDYNIPVDMNYDDPVQNLHIHFIKGMQHLNGTQAEEYVRFRHPNTYNNAEIAKYYDGSDLNRISAQQSFIKELIRQKLSIYYIPRISGIIDTLFGSIKTNMDMSDALRMTVFLSKISTDNIQWFTLPVKAVVQDLYYYIMDKDKTAQITSNDFQTAG